MSDNNNQNNKNNEIVEFGDIYAVKFNANSENFYPLLYAMTLEYSKLEDSKKKKYMDLLTEWYMREKDILRNKLN